MVGAAIANVNIAGPGCEQCKGHGTVGRTVVAEVILHCPSEVDSMAVADLLVSQRRWGQTRCRKLLAELPMSEKKTVGSMTDRQRYALASMLSSTERDHASSTTP